MTVEGPIPEPATRVRVTAQPPAPPGHILISSETPGWVGPGQVGTYDKPVLTLTRDDALALAEMLLATLVVTPAPPDPPT